MNDSGDKKSVLSDRTKRNLMTIMLEDARDRAHFETVQLRIAGDSDGVGMVVGGVVCGIALLLFLFWAGGVL